MVALGSKIQGCSKPGEDPGDGVLEACKQGMFTHSNDDRRIEANDVDDSSPGRNA